MRPSLCFHPHSLTKRIRGQKFEDMLDKYLTNIETSDTIPALPQHLVIEWPQL